MATTKSIIDTAKHTCTVCRAKLGTDEPHGLTDCVREACDKLDALNLTLESDAFSERVKDVIGATVDESFIMDQLDVEELADSIGEHMSFVTEDALEEALRSDERDLERLEESLKSEFHDQMEGETVADHLMDNRWFIEGMEKLIEVTGSIEVRALLERVRTLETVVLGRATDLCPAQSAEGEWCKAMDEHLGPCTFVKPVVEQAKKDGASDAVASGI